MTIIHIYFSVSIILFVFEGIYFCTEGAPDGIDNFWDFLVFEIFWGLRPLKAVFKFFKIFFGS